MNEELKSEDAKRMYRVLSKKFHPDLKGNVSKMKEINVAKDVGDTAIKKLYDKLINVKKTNDLIKDIRNWMDKIQDKHKVIKHYITRHNVDGTIFINVFLANKDFTIMNAHKLDYDTLLKTIEKKLS